MDNQEIEETQEIDELDTDSIVEDEIVDNGEEEKKTAPDKKKNKSNFNNLYKKTKELEKLLESKEEELASKTASLKEWEDLNPEIKEDKKNNEEVDNLKVSIFTIKNPESEPHLTEIQKVMKDYNIDIDKAWKLVKIDLPEESKTKTDFDIWKNNISKKDLKNVTPEEALKLPKDKQREWRKLHLK